MDEPTTFFVGKEMVGLHHDVLVRLPVRLHRLGVDHLSPGVLDDPPPNSLTGESVSDL